MAQIIKRPLSGDDVLSMNRQPQHVPTKRSAHTKRPHQGSENQSEMTTPGEASATREHLVLCYRILSEAYEAVQGISESADEEMSGAVAIIIEDDLRSLLEECEGFLLDRIGPNASGLSSFEARSLTVIDEVNSIISLLLPRSRGAWH